MWRRISHRTSRSFYRVEQHSTPPEQLRAHLDAVESEVAATRLVAHLDAVEYFSRSAGLISARWQPDHGRLTLQRGSTRWVIASRDPGAAQIAALIALGEAMVELRVLLDGTVLIIAEDGKRTFCLNSVAVHMV